MPLASPLLSPDDPSNIHSPYPDNTGVSSPISNEAQHRGYSPVTTDKSGQHIHNTIGDPVGDAEAVPPYDAQKDIVNNNDLWVDITPAE